MNMRLVIATLSSLTICGVALFLLQGLYDSPLAEDGPAYPQATEHTLYPVHTFDPPPNACPEAEAEALAAMNELRACTDANQCMVIITPHLPLVAINAANRIESVNIRNKLNQFCNDNMVSDWFTNYGPMFTCDNGICDVHAMTSEEKKQQLYRETLMETGSRDTP
jgi:hypothetical protein